MTETETTRLLVLWDTGNATFSVQTGKSAQIGRAAGCEIALTLPSVSRRHAELTVVSTAVSAELATIEDLGGMNGVTVSGDRIPQDVAYPVGAGDLIELGGAFLMLHAPRGGRGGGDVGGAVVRATARRPRTDDTLVDRLVDILGRAELPILVLGAMGTGKTFFASCVHERSGRTPEALVSLACAAATPDQALAAIAAAAGAGAAGGTLLLEEVSELSPAAQAELARGLHETRVIATSRRPILPLVESGGFLPELHARLAGVNVVLPPLRERGGELSRFAGKFLAAVTSPGRRPPRLSSEALRVLVRHPFPGNLGELRETMERAYRLATAGFIGPEHLRLEAPPTEPPPHVTGRRFEPVTRRFGPIAPTEPPDAPTEEIAIVVPPAPPTPQRLPSPVPRPPSSRKKKRT